jgi:hypothetical protein
MAASGRYWLVIGLEELGITMTDLDQDNVTIQQTS